MCLKYRIGEENVTLYEGRVMKMEIEGRRARLVEENQNGKREKLK